MTDVVAELKRVIESDLLDEEGRGFRFVYGPKAHQNLAAPADGAVVYLDYPISSADTIQTSGNVQERYDLRFFIGYKSDFKNWTPEQHSAVCAQARYGKNRLTSLLTHARYPDDRKLCLTVEALGNSTDVHNIFDRNLSGTLFGLRVVFNATTKTC